MANKKGLGNYALLVSRKKTMIKSATHWLLKASLSLVFWVFFLSVSWDGERLFDILHDKMVDNEIVSAAEDGVKGVFDAVVLKVQSKYANVKKPQSSSTCKEDSLSDDCQAAISQE